MDFNTLILERNARGDLVIRDNIDRIRLIMEAIGRGIILALVKLEVLPLDFDRWVIYLILGFSILGMGYQVFRIVKRSATTLDRTGKKLIKNGKSIAQIETINSVEIHKDLQEDSDQKYSVRFLMGKKRIGIEGSLKKEEAVELTEILSLELNKKVIKKHF